MRRSDVTGLARVHGATASDGALDLRLGAALGTVTAALRSPQPFARRRGRADAEIVEADRAYVAVVQADDFLELARERRIPTA
jgi:hypothetical protein